MNPIKRIMERLIQFCKRRLHKHYVSELDRFLAELDHLYPEPSATQQAEIKKYDRIFRLRDSVTTQSSSHSPI